MKPTKHLKLLWLAAPLAFAVGCTDAAKIPAEAALKAAEAAVATLDAEATKYVPDQVDAIKAAVAGAKTLVTKQDYKGALTALEPIPGKVKEALAAAAAKKDALVKAWGEATANVPAMLAALKSRLGILAESRKLPKGLEKATVAQAKEGLAAIEGAFQKASAEFQAGNVEQAIAQAKGLLPRGNEIMKSLGMTVPGS